MKKTIILIYILLPLEVYPYYYVGGDLQLSYNFYGGYYEKNFLSSFEENLFISYSSYIYDPRFLILQVAPYIENENFLGGNNWDRLNTGATFSIILFQTRPISTRLYYGIGYNRWSILDTSYSQLFHRYGGILKLRIDKFPPVSFYYHRSIDSQRDDRKSGGYFREKFGNFNVFVELTRNSIRYEDNKIVNTYFQFYNTANITQDFSFYNTVQIGTINDNYRADFININNTLIYAFNPNLSLNLIHGFQKGTTDGTESRGDSGSAYLIWNASKRLSFKGGFNLVRTTAGNGFGSKSDMESILGEVYYREPAITIFSPSMRFSASVGRAHRVQDGYSKTGTYYALGAGIYTTSSVRDIFFIDLGGDYGITGNPAEYTERTDSINVSAKLRSRSFTRHSIFFEDYTNYSNNTLYSNNGKVLSEVIYSEGGLSAFIYERFLSSTGLGYRKSTSDGSSLKEFYLYLKLSGRIIRGMSLSTFILIDIPSLELSSGGSLGASISYRIREIEIGFSYEHFVVDSVDRFRGMIYLRRIFEGFF